MTIISIILGIILMIGGVTVMFTPIGTFLFAGYFICIMLFIYGIFGLFRAIKNKGNALEYITSILALIVGIVAIARPGSTLFIDALILILVAIWFLVQGVSSIVLAIKTKATNSSWVVLLIAGILGLIVAIISFIHPMVEVVAIGFMIGFFLIQTGLDMIGFASIRKKDGE